MTERFSRKENRLRCFDYDSAGVYFVTICAAANKKIFRNDDGTLTETGKVIENAILSLSGFYDGVEVEKYVIMPNHIHLLISFSKEKNVSLSRVINQFKGSVTKKIKTSVWQKSFYDHIVRNEKDHERIWKYIDENPLRWELDEYYC